LFHVNHKPEPNPAHHFSSGVSLSLFYSRRSFTLLGSTNGSTFMRSFSGYSPLLRVGLSLETITRGGRASVSAVHLAPRRARRSSLVRALQFGRGTADPGRFRHCDDLRRVKFRDPRGFVAHWPVAPPSFILADAPLVGPVSTFWYRRLIIAARNNWTQIATDAVNSGDSAIAFSRQQMTVPPGAPVGRSCISPFWAAARRAASIPTFDVGGSIAIAVF
jgi:hypothetical protein